MNWVVLSLLSAFGQALGWALKKKSLESRGVNNTLGAVSFAIAGAILSIMYGLFNGWVLPDLCARFWKASLIVIGANILAVWAAYRALDRAPLSLLMPFVSVTALAIVPIEYFVQGSLPHLIQVVGVAMVVLGATLFATKPAFEKESMKALGYFGITILCYSVAPSFMRVAVDESQSGLFSAAVFHVGIALGFIPIVVIANEQKVWQRLAQQRLISQTAMWMVAAGAVMALLENGPATVALAEASAVEVVSLKRTMPVFALILGVLMFDERVNKRHMIATVFLVIGSMIIVWFR